MRASSEDEARAFSAAGFAGSIGRLPHRLAVRPSPDRTVMATGPGPNKSVVAYSRAHSLIDHIMKWTAIICARERGSTTASA